MAATLDTYMDFFRNFVSNDQSNGVYDGIREAIHLVRALFPGSAPADFDHATVFLNEAEPFNEARPFSGIWILSPGATWYYVPFPRGGSPHRGAGPPAAGELYRDRSHPSAGKGRRARVHA